MQTAQTVAQCRTALTVAAILRCVRRVRWGITAATAMLAQGSVLIVWTEARALLVSLGII